jgi:hypothetical protein
MNLENEYLRKLEWLCDIFIISNLLEICYYLEPFPFCRCMTTRGSVAKMRVRKGTPKSTVRPSGKNLTTGTKDKTARQARKYKDYHELNR